MIPLAKIIKRLLFGPSLEDYEARQKANTEAAVQAMHADEERWKKQARIIVERQRQFVQAQNKGIIKWVADGNSNITATVSNGR